MFADAKAPQPAGIAATTHQGGRPVAKTAIDNVLKIQQQYEEARKAAVEEIQVQIRELQDQLRALGVREGTRPAGKSKGAGTVGDKPCSVCGFKTTPPHDSRSHRSQKSKKPFTKEELDARNLTKS